MSANWKEHQFGVAYHACPERGACYAVYLDGSLTYIGQTGNLKKRMAQHNIRFGYGGGILTPWGQGDAVRIKVSFGRRYGDWAMRELRLIRRLQPPANCVGSIKRRAA